MRFLTTPRPLLQGTMRPFSLVGSAYSAPDQDIVCGERELLSGGLILQCWGILPGEDVEVVGSIARGLRAGGGWREESQP